MLDECDGGIIQVQTMMKVVASFFPSEVDPGSDACAVRASDVRFCFIRNK